MATYDPLSEFLRDKAPHSVTLSFAQIENVLRRDLPATARNRAEWWANEDPQLTRHVQSKAWMQNGYTASVDIENEVVEFNRSE